MGFNYPKNLCFECSLCGICCGDTKTKTRHILLLKAEALRIATHTNRKTKEIARETSGIAPYSYEMLKKPSSGMCIFLDNNKCTIYGQRPLVCRFYPFELTTDELGTFIFKETAECPAINSPESKAKKSLGAQFFADLLKLASAQFHESLSN